ncbi:hypothetical protein [Alteromonas gracilis]|uniref:Ig-like domain-containing protein n=1 Tax=Alteromonas gracilis TaxID=1479524 RepID=A0ABX5CUJ6_9ALTE|nr:hypothetical protein [Alteromonas gracilis]PRO70121.1 hypothetical protein C6Y39_04470 [Alteromonas gracilis]
MIDGIWPLVLIGLVVAGALGLVTLLLLSKSDIKSSKVTFWIALSGVVLVITPTLIQSVKKPEAYVFVKCQATSETVPSTVSCTAEASDYHSLQWSINNEVIEDATELNIEREIYEPGEYSVKVQITNKNLFRKAESSFSTQVVISEPQPPEPEVLELEVKESFSENSKFPKTIRLYFPPKNGFEIVDAKLESMRTSQAYDIQVSLENGVAVVSGQLKPKNYFKGFSMRPEPARVSGIVTLTQKQVQ